MGRSTQMMNAMKFMFFLALVVFVSATPVNEDDIVPETKLVDAGSASGSGSGSGSSTKTAGSSSKTAGSSSKTAGSSSTTKSGKKCKAGTKVAWWTSKYQSSAPTGNNLAIKNKAINDCQTHCTTNLGGAKRCNGKIDEHNLSKSPYPKSVMCDCNSAFKTAVVSLLGIAVVLLANIRTSLRI